VRLSSVGTVCFGQWTPAKGGDCLGSVQGLNLWDVTLYKGIVAEEWSPWQFARGARKGEPVIR